MRKIFGIEANMELSVWVGSWNDFNEWWILGGNNEYLFNILKFISELSDVT